MDLRKAPQSQNFMDNTAMYGILMDRYRRLRPIMRPDMTPSEHIAAMMLAAEEARQINEGYPGIAPNYRRPNFRKARK